MPMVPQEFKRMLLEALKDREFARKIKELLK